ncbi:ABC transporter substrate-binding protein [Microterricola pindariensis]|uniref:Sugar ABC transporter substrate-binding protein n=1 Tax=Microterricola pindariensis TaxID=478010 RepID=A0ABX5ATU9_9MICO|nr:sugar ABC transporter substrate-binding protein [Microterricola pindariensis]PPL15451.1 hypothetical protein GY24_14275 [Microterricola pindariensis]
MKNSHSNWMRMGAVLGASALLLGTMAGCAADSGSGAPEDVDAALQEETTLTWWTWGDDTQEMADAFTKENPKIKIEVVKMDNPDAVVTKLQNAVKAGTGAPDLVPAEYQTIPQLTMGGALADMSEFGIDEFAGDFTESTWNAMNFQGKQTGIPMDSGPMVMIYNQELFNAAGITAAPTTWDEYAAASAAINAYDPEAYIANSGDAGFMTSMFWASGGTPFSVDGENVTIDLQDAGTKKFADYWGTLLTANQLSPVSTWSDEWSKALEQGKLGSLLMGSWMISGMDDYSHGNWRVAQIPSWDGKPASAQNGGSGLAVTEQSKHKAAAAAVLEFMATGTGRDIQNTKGFPGTTAIMDDPAWLDVEFATYDGQKANVEGKTASENVIDGWQYLPFQGYANNIFGDTVGKVLGEKGDINAGLVAWQSDLVEYGNAQGFTVNK